MDKEYKEVFFHQYCKTCEHESVDENKNPCEECLDNPTNLDSHKPINWEEKTKKGSSK